MEERARLEAERAGAWPVNIGSGEVAREQIGRELHPPEITMQGGGELLDGGRFRQAGCAFDHEMAVGEQGDQQAVDEMLLADDAGAQVPAQPGKGRMAHSLGQDLGCDGRSCIHGFGLLEPIGGTGSVGFAGLV